MSSCLWSDLGPERENTVGLKSAAETTRTGECRARRQSGGWLGRPGGAALVQCPFFRGGNLLGKKPLFWGRGSPLVLLFAAPLCGPRWPPALLRCLQPAAESPAPLCCFLLEAAAARAECGGAGRVTARVPGARARLAGTRPGERPPCCLVGLGEDTRFSGEIPAACVLSELDPSPSPLCVQRGEGSCWTLLPGRAQHNILSPCPCHRTLSLRKCFRTSKLRSE